MLELLEKNIWFKIWLIKEILSKQLYKIVIANIVATVIIDQQHCFRFRFSFSWSCSRFISIHIISITAAVVIIVAIITDIVFHIACRRYCRQGRSSGTGREREQTNKAILPIAERVSYNN